MAQSGNRHTCPADPPPPAAPEGSPWPAGPDRSGGSGYHSGPAGQSCAAGQHGASRFRQDLLRLVAKPGPLGCTMSCRQAGKGVGEVVRLAPELKDIGDEHRWPCRIFLLSERVGVISVARSIGLMSCSAGASQRPEFSGGGEPLVLIGGLGTDLTVYEFVVNRLCYN
jgi:hypothetical protein